MANRALPILFLNLSGEMLYILNQRLTAQKIAPDKSRKVMQDIVSTMFNRRFIEEIFKPQLLYSKSSMRMLFDRLAHASIMRLNAASMDKLYDLMTMAVKYQITMCLRPSDVMLITLNHLDSVSKYVEPSSPQLDLINTSLRLLVQNYEKLSNGQWQTVRQTILNFFQDIHIRVSIFLKDKSQNSNGRFIHPLGGPLGYGIQPPGEIRMFNSGGVKEKTLPFPVSPAYTAAAKQGAMGMKGDRVTKLGLNMYSAARPVEVQAMGGTRGAQSGSGSGAMVSASSDIDSMTPNPNAKAQLDLLSSLIGGGGGTSAKAPPSSSQFKLNLFNSEEEEVMASNQKPIIPNDPGSQVVTIDASNRSKNEELTRIMGELNVKDSDNSQELDLLDLMDRT